MSYNPTERIGVSRVETTVTQELGWIFREQLVADFGIDAQLEIVDGNPTGKLIAAQIKSGDSYAEEKDDHFIFRGKLRHLDYWNDHSLPVILILYIPKYDNIYWQVVSEENLTRTNKTWKLNIPKSNILNSQSKYKLGRLGDGTLQQQRLRQVQLLKPTLEKLASGSDLFLETEEWVHKSLGRGDLKLILTNKDGSESVVFHKSHFYAGYSFYEILQIRFPWAKISVDEDYYDVNFCESVYDIYSKLYIELEPIYPYRVGAGEVAFYRLRMEISDFGNHILRFLDYLETGHIPNS
ncbi:DUF4365 domain-containing protein [Glycocaulis sp.]|uniref:DUF4365 domain-containing protein n=1 Tax=Glycocaulis sp. TaxID=1969725 RepID=UPI003D1C7873